MIITGMASELVAMMWLRNVGTMWRRMMRMREQPARRAASTKSSSRRARKRPRTSRPKRRPADQRQDHGDGEEDLDRRPVARQGGRQRQPDRDGGHRLQQLDQALDHLIGLAADIARDAAQHDAQDDAERHRDQADRHRCLGAVHDARPLIAAQPIGAQQEDALVGIDRHDQVAVGLEQAEDLPLVAGAEEGDRHLLLGVGRPFHAQGRGVALADDGRHPGREAAVVEQVHRLHRDEGLARVGALGVLGREEIRHQDDEVHEDQQHRARHRQVMAAEAPPHELPVGGDGNPVLGLLADGDVCGGHWTAGLQARS